MIVAIDGLQLGHFDQERPDGLTGNLPAANQGQNS